ncbi:MAG: HEAT repeat domain-containing protein [Armatimonadota bacterium]|nr:HEAT repeat domain-containing protein [Armatimonadota bacterium]
MLRFATTAVAALLLMCGLAPAEAAAREPVPLNSFTRLGQRFTATHPFYGVWVVVPSWSDNEGGLTLTLWDSPARRRKLAQKSFTDVVDNAHVEVRSRRLLPAGSYYWEVDQRTGQTRIGLYSDILDSDTADCAYLDGKPDPKRRFSFGIAGVAFVYENPSRLLARVKSPAPLPERMEACRQLAVTGTRAAVPVLAGLLGDPQLSHMARYALERLPYGEVDAAFREALHTLHGAPLVGVINSVGVRRDPRAVPLLALLVGNADTEVARAAAAALGEIATPGAADALQRASLAAPSAVRDALEEGTLACARGLAQRGERARSRALYDHLREKAASAAVRAAALRGAILARGTADMTLLTELLCGENESGAAVALWVVQRELPGEALTRAVAAELFRVPAARQPLVVEALAQRGDRAALPVLLSAARSADKPVRLAALRALALLSDPSVVPVLANAVLESDDDTARTAREALALLPRGEATAAALSLLAHTHPQARRAGVALVVAQRLPRFLPALQQAARDVDPEVRVAALKALGELGDAEAFAPLLDLLLLGESEADREAAAGALAAVTARAGDPDRWAGPVAERMVGAGPEQRAVLLRVLASLGGLKALAAVRGALDDPHPEVRAAAMEALAGWETVDAAPYLLDLARTATTPDQRLRWVRACLRIAANQDVPPEQRLALCRETLPLIERDEERKLLLGALGGIASPDALALVLPHLDNPATREEASGAVVRIAEKLVTGPHAARARAALERVASASGNPEMAKRARELLQSAPTAP